MTRPLPFALATLLIGLSACNGAVMDPLSEPRSAGLARPGAAGTTPDPQDPPLIRAPVSVRVQGVVTQVPSALPRAAFLIEEAPDRPASPGGTPLLDGEKYYVIVTDETRIRRRGEDGQSRAATLADIGVGTRAQVEFVGPILESYPAQGTAGVIMIFDSIP